MGVELGEPYERFDDIWEITFIVHSANLFSNEKITGTGNAILVFSTVIDIISHAVDSKNIQTLTFSANHDEPTRVKLYDRMAAVFAKKGWRYIDDREITARSDSRHAFGGTGSSSYILTKHPRPVTESILMELFDRTVPWEYSPETEHGNIVAVFSLEDKDGVEMLYEVNFVEEADEEMLSGMDTPFPPNTGSLWDLNFTAEVANSRFGMKSLTATGGGKGLIIFATVLEIMDKTVNQYNINNITFSAAKREPTRIKLYNRMTQQMADSWFVMPPEAVTEHFNYLNASPEHVTWFLIKR
jgi:hypothetical protein